MATVANIIKPEVLDLLAQRLHNQQERCVDQDGGCMYADGEGHYCAVGFLLTPHEISQLHIADLMSEPLPALPYKLRIDLANRAGADGSVIEDTISALTAIQVWHDHTTVVDGNYAHCIRSGASVETIRALIGALRVKLD